MGKYHGTIRKNDLEGGSWELETENGERYTLSGEFPQKDGLEVEVEGKVERGGMGIGFGAPTLAVKSAKKK